VELWEAFSNRNVKNVDENLTKEAFRKIVHALVILVKSKKLNADSEYSPRTDIYLNALKI
jgi:hypothetical protein